MKKLSIIALLATTIYGATPEQPGADAVPSITNGQHDDLLALAQSLFTDNMSAEGKLRIVSNLSKIPADKHESVVKAVRLFPMKDMGHFSIDNLIESIALLPAGQRESCVALAQS